MMSEEFWRREILFSGVSQGFILSKRAERRRWFRSSRQWIEEGGDFDRKVREDA